MLKFYVKDLGPHDFQTLWWIWNMLGMMIDIGPKFYGVPFPCPIHDLKVKVTELYVKSFTLKFLGPQYFQTMLYFINVLYDDRYWSKI